MPELRDLELLIRSSVPIIVVETHEEPRAVEAFKRLALTRVRRPLFRWTATEGLQRIDIEAPPQRHNAKPIELLAQIKASRQAAIYVLLDFHPFLEDPVHVRMLKDVALANHEVDNTLALVSHRVSIPGELTRFCAHVDFAVPDRERLELMIREEANQWSKQHPGCRIKTERRILDRVIDSLSGLPLDDARRLARGAIRDDNALTEHDLPEVMKAKFELLNQGGVLGFAFDTARFADVGGLARLKHWLEIRKRAFTEEVPLAGLDPPRGILLLGVQGCGKSLAAKAVAGTWGVPLLQLDFGALYSKFHGETERNLRSSLNAAEVMEPCVLWIDEIEKSISTDDHDSGTSRRILGHLLTWLAENESRVFVVATANDIESLPPELLRKGRLDEVFFVDLPDSQTRKKIFEIHLRKRELAVDEFDLERLAQASEGFSGSEVEQVIVSALYAAYAQKARPGSDHLCEEMARTRPLSVLMAERINSLRSWAAARTVPAS